MSRNELVLVTGAAGFVGLHLIRELRQSGINVRALVRRQADIAKVEEYGGPGIDYIIGDLRDVECADNSVAGVDTIFHLAAATSGGMHDQIEGTYIGTENLLDAANAEAGVNHFVYTSTVSVLAQTKFPNRGVIESDFMLEDQPVARGAYSYSKLKTETLVSRYRDKSEFLITIVRPGLIWGGEKSQLALDLNIALGRLLIIFGSSRKRQPLVHVQSVTDALLRCMTLRESCRESLTLVDNNNPTQREYLKLLNLHTGSRYIPFFVSPLLLRPLAWLADKVLTRIVGVNPHIRYKFKSKESRAHYATESSKAVLGWTGEPVFESRIRQEHVNA